MGTVWVWGKHLSVPLSSLWFDATSGLFGEPHSTTFAGDTILIARTAPEPSWPLSQPRCLVVGEPVLTRSPFGGDLPPSTCSLKMRRSLRGRVSPPVLGWGAGWIRTESSVPCMLE